MTNHMIFMAEENGTLTLRDFSNITRGAEPYCTDYDLQTIRVSNRVLNYST